MPNGIKMLPLICIVFLFIYNVNTISIMGIPQKKNVSEHNSTPNTKNTAQVPEVNINNSRTNETSLNLGINSYKNSAIESGALMRGIYIFVAFSLIFFIYLAVKTYRNKRSNVIVRKYGVRTRRSDHEMEPLPLDDNDEDETVFDVGNFNRQ